MYKEKCNFVLLTNIESKNINFKYKKNKEVKNH